MKLLLAFHIAAVWALVSADLTVDDLDLFDVVEDVKQNFYDFLEVPANSTTSDIRKAYRRLSLLYHPDKNSDPDAPEKFRKIASVVEVLKDEKKRAKYHEVLEYGIPDWARSMYYRYYRKARKMGSTEMSVLMAIIVTVAQTLWMYASYWEKKFTINSNVNEAIKRKKLRSTNTKKNKAAEEEIRQLREELMSHIIAPTFKDIWFVSFPISMFYGILALPSLIKERLKKEEIPEEAEEEEEEEIVRPKRTPRQRTEVKGAQVVNGNAPVVTTTKASAPRESGQKELKSGPWTDTEVAALIRLLKKFPVGTQDRWDKISEALNRSTADVTEKTKTLRTSNTNVIPQQQSTNKSLWVESEITSKSSDEDENDEGDEPAEKLDPTEWSQAQQKQLELAMVAFPKWTEGRWDLISDRVDGKSKRACISRVQWLIENIKKKKTEQVE
ncbi:uncharacterized protein F54F2.9 [Galendromus occidentalis]|uniref:DnaJ homolog subfamily C member 2 n=1 Tax=Galendromus occidentalis TaxID=34638 RepID=A0AAJ6VZX7_9ACAR|nr:uncharacterized protein F54F2.9 [Galendromus occidentalis]